MTPVTKPPANLIVCKSSHILYLCDRMRDDEIAQYQALVSGQKTFEPDAAALGFMNIPGAIRFTLVDDDSVPICAGGWHEFFPGVWQSWMVGTSEGWAHHWRSITKASRWVMDGLFQQAGARRLQTNALASRTQAIEWYERSLGMTREGTWRGFGTNGEDVALFSRVRGDL
jgi:hypothetical protein